MHNGGIVMDLENSRHRRLLGKTGIEVSTLCYGCGAAYARDLISDEFSSELFKKAFDLGINFFDTGHSYGKAEERIGLALKNNRSINRRDIVISTKFGTRLSEEGKYIHDVSTEWAKKSVELSLERMGIDYIDVLYIHAPHEKDLTDEPLLYFLDDLKSQGVIRATGANTFFSKIINKIAEEHIFDVVQLDFNIAKQEREPEILNLFNNQIAVCAGQAMAESVFLNELFKIRKKKDLWYLARTLGRRASRELFFEAQKYRFLNNLNGLDGSQVALKYVIDTPGVSSAAFGTCSIEHLEKDVSALDINIPQQIREKIKNA